MIGMSNISPRKLHTGARRVLNARRARVHVRLLEYAAVQTSRRDTHTLVSSVRLSGDESGASSSKLLLGSGHQPPDTSHKGMIRPSTVAVRETNPWSVGEPRWFNSAETSPGRRFVSGRAPRGRCRIGPATICEARRAISRARHLAARASPDGSVT